MDIVTLALARKSKNDGGEWKTINFDPNGKTWKQFAEYLLTVFPEVENFTDGYRYFAFKTPMYSTRSSGMDELPLSLIYGFCIKLKTDDTDSTFVYGTKSNSREFQWDGTDNTPIKQGWQFLPRIQGAVKYCKDEIEFFANC